MSQQKSPKKNNLKNAAMLSGIAFEMGAIIFLSVKGGKWLDTHYENEKNIFTVIATLLGVAISIWVVLQQLKRIKY
ncbi:AtpZ/AtpI family protein [Flagellimonas sp. HMM57]|uniref:AtpZ/AtpI family protein n=1 Tax=unclassified Flagellimonas TaxID=2644544 RepID=UPI0013D7F9B7|nr:MULTISPECIES: AtpZ/AtpI family protein [unclassified Flagellimonas]UII77562.1 AtpZ/AtpI family protein [Flagellimonas sp. HMM57]